MSLKKQGTFVDDDDFMEFGNSPDRFFTSDEEDKKSYLDDEYLSNERVDELSNNSFFNQSTRPRVLSKYSANNVGEMSSLILINQNDRSKSP
jgi:hypothetical protein